jgi:hypothetical protein
LTSAAAIGDWLRTHMRKGDGLSRPYARRWETAGRGPTHFLWTWPTDRLASLASALQDLGASVVGIRDGVRVDFPGRPVVIGVNRSGRGDGPPDAFSVRLTPDLLPEYVGNSPEVVEELLRGLARSAPPAAANQHELQVGFPGADADPTYVGSPEWDIHGEVRGDAALRLATAATTAAIDKGRSRS